MFAPYVKISNATCTRLCTVKKTVKVARVQKQDKNNNNFYIQFYQRDLKHVL